MMLAAASDWTPVLAAACTGALALAGVIVTQLRVHADNRADHLRGIEATRALAGEVHEVRDDVREIKADVRDHGQRIRELEHQEDHP